MKKRKILVVYYSRSGTTRKVAEKIAKDLSADIEEIIEVKNRKGVIGWLSSGRDAMKKNPSEIKNFRKSIKDYDLVVIGSPLFAGSVSAPVRTFLSKTEKDLKDVAFFCSLGGSDPSKLFLQMEELARKKPLAVCSILSREAKKNDFKKINDFISKLNGQ